jgi:hypothetical protein
MLTGLAAADASAAETERAIHAGKVAAVVEKIIGTHIRVETRDNEGRSIRAPLLLFQQLQEGDAIVIEDPAGVVQVALVGTAERRTILYDNSPFKVPAPGSEPSFWRNLGKQVVAAPMQFISHLSSDHEEARDTIASISRGGTTGGDLRAPVFQYGAQRVVAGERTFTVAWEGGEPPYMVDIKREGSAEPVLRREALPNAELPPAAISLLPGPHALIIRDKDYAHMLRRSFLVVDKGAQPSPGQPSPFESLPPDAGATLAAVWLAAQQGGIWTLESVQQVGDLARSGYQPAVLLRDRLLFDSSPVELPEVAR